MRDLERQWLLRCARLPSLVPLGTELEKPIVFVPHASHGTVDCYRQLAGLLAQDVLLAGLAHPALDTDDPPPASIPELAARHVDVLLSCLPSGPFRLAGWSLGGVVAFEIARQLHALGHEVAPVVLVDSHLAAAARDRPGNRQLAGEFLASFEAGAPAGSGLRRSLEGVPDSELPQALRAPLVRAGVIGPDFPDGVLVRRFEVFRANVVAARSYAARPYPGEVVLIRAGRSAGSAPADVALTTRVVPGDHYSLLTGSAAAEVADVLRAVFGGPTRTAGSAPEDSRGDGRHVRGEHRP